LHSLHSQLPVLVLYCMRWRHCSFGEGRMRRTAAPYYILYLRQHRQHYQLLQDPDAFVYVHHGCIHLYIRFAFMLHVLHIDWQSNEMTIICDEVKCDTQEMLVRRRCPSINCNQVRRINDTINHFSFQLVEDVLHYSPRERSPGCGRIHRE
jgi:hypothetical protein